MNAKGSTTFGYSQGPNMLMVGDVLTIHRNLRWYVRAWRWLQCVFGYVDVRSRYVIVQVTTNTVTLDRAMAADLPTEALLWRSYEGPTH